MCWGGTAASDVSTAISVTTGNQEMRTDLWADTSSYRGRLRAHIRASLHSCQPTPKGGFHGDGGDDDEDEKKRKKGGSALTSAADGGHHFCPSQQQPPSPSSARLLGGFVSERKLCWVFFAAQMRHRITSIQTFPAKSISLCSQRAGG